MRGGGVTMQDRKAACSPGCKRARWPAYLSYPICNGIVLIKH